MKQYWTAPLLLGGSLLLAWSGAAGQTAGTLDFYTIDVEGGKAVLIVSPARESMLIDVGWPKSPTRDPSTDVIVDAAKQAGLSQIDYLVVSHYDGDHIGDVPALAARIPIRHLIDHGEIRFPPPTAGAPPPTAAAERFNAYAALRKAIDHRVVQAGDTIPIKGITVEVVTVGGAHISKPLRSAKSAGTANPLCATHPQQPIIERDVEDNQSIGLLFSFGSFRMLDLADLEAHRSHELVCPINLIGQVDVYHVNVHGQFKGMAAELVGAIKPTVAIMGNGPRKGADPETWPVIRAVPGLQDIWQTHYAEHGSPETNPPADFIANVQGPADDHKLVKLSVSADGSYRITNTRNGFTKTYRAGAAAMAASAQQYAARHAADVVQLEDSKNHTEVAIVPSIGNQAFEMKMNGVNVLRRTYGSIEEFKVRPGMAGIPFLGPWANRLDEQAFYANGKRYALDMELGNVAAKNLAQKGLYKELQYVQPGGTWVASFWVKPTGF